MCVLSDSQAVTYTRAASTLRDGSETELLGSDFFRYSGLRNVVEYVAYAHEVKYLRRQWCMEGKTPRVVLALVNPKALAPENPTDW